MSLIKDISRYLSINEDEVIKIANRSPKTYRTYLIPKKSTGYRTIHHPAKETKTLQYAILNIVFSNYCAHPAAVGYIKGLQSPLRVNAEKHAKYKFSVKLDFKNFFHSIKFEDLASILTEAFSSQELDFLKGALFLNYKGNYCLAIGAPSSPFLSNIIMKKFDQKISELVLSEDPDATYTRYADDLTVSSNSKEKCLKILKSIPNWIKQVKSPSLALNENKTLFLSKANRRMVTGLTITSEGEVSIGRANKRYIKKLFNDLKYSKISIENKSYLKGYLAFIRDVEPRFVLSLTKKYGADLINEVI